MRIAPSLVCTILLFTCLSCQQAPQGGQSNTDNQKAVTDTSAGAAISGVVFQYIQFNSHTGDSLTKRVTSDGVFSGTRCDDTGCSSSSHQVSLDAWVYNVNLARTGAVKTSLTDDCDPNLHVIATGDNGKVLLLQQDGCFTTTNTSDGAVHLVGASNQ
jgi:hypothetical protein